MDRRYLPGLGKASMLQTSHPRLQFLGWGWFKVLRLKAPGSPAENLFQPGTAGQGLLRPTAVHQLATAGHKQHCHGTFRWIMLFVSLQPFEHRTCDAQTCHFLRAALSCRPDVAPCGRAFGTTCTPFPSLGDVESSLQSVPDALMQRYLRQQLQPQRAWRTGAAESVCCSTTWQTLLTLITILGRTSRDVLGYRTPPSEFVETNRELVEVGRRIVRTVSTWWLPTIRLATGAAAAVDGPAQETRRSGYTIVRSSRFVATMFVKITVSSRIAWMYRYRFAHDIMVTFPGAVPPFWMTDWIQKPLREFLPMMIVHQRHGNTIFLDEPGSLDYRLPGTCCPVWCTDGLTRDYLVNSAGMCVHVWQDFSWQQYFELKHTFSFSNRQVWQCPMVKSLHRPAWPEMPFHVQGSLPPKELAWRPRQHRPLPQSLRAAYLDDRRVLSSGSMSNSVAGFSSNVALFRTAALMTGPTLDTALTQARTTPGYRMVSPFLSMNGGAA
eukprot:1784536-Amphidinium_carterae.1